MKPYYVDGPVTLWAGDCLDVLRELPDASVDAVVTDPPYGLEFMGKDWDRPWAVSASNGVGYAGRDDLTLPAHRDSRNANCRACGGRARGAKRCECAAPRWDRDPADDMRAFQAWCELWAAECLRVLRPGGHMLAFGGTRTSHRLACAIEDAGFEIRDSIAWLYGSGFPKSLDVSKAIDRAAGAERAVVGMHAQPATPRVGTFNASFGEATLTAPATDDARAWQGWGTALKPAHEPIVVARKPLTGTVAANVLAHGTGALNVDGCRVEGVVPQVTQGAEDRIYGGGKGLRSEPMLSNPHAAGRWPPNVVLDESQAAALDEMSGVSASPPVGSVTRTKASDKFGTFATPDRTIMNGYGDSGGASRFFYVAKADSAERPRYRKEGVDPMRFQSESREARCSKCGKQRVNVPGSFCVCPEPDFQVDTKRNGGGQWVSHPTVKPLALMRWLVRLVTPPGGTVLEPFAGSGTTVEACVLEGFKCIAIERETDYLPLITSRLQQGTLDFGDSA